MTISKAPKLSKRLLSISEYIIPGPFYDLCCDHGKLGLYAERSCKSSPIYYVDQSKKVCDELAKNHPDANIQCIDAGKITILEDSVSISIAGVGGDLTIKILEKLLSKIDWTQHRIILCAHSKIYELRKYLMSKKIGIFDEKIIYDSGQFYEVIVLGDKYPITQFGSIMYENSREHALDYAKKIFNHARSLSKHTKEWQNIRNIMEEEFKEWCPRVFEV